MSETAPADIIVGVDTHKHVHAAAASARSVPASAQ